MALFSNDKAEWICQRAQSQYLDARRNLERANEATERALEALGRKQWDVAVSLSVFSDCMERIQERPVFAKLQSQGLRLPPLDLQQCRAREAELKKLVSSAANPPLALASVSCGLVLGSGFLLSLPVFLALNAIWDGQVDQAYLVEARASEYERKAREQVRFLERLGGEAESLYHAMDALNAIYRRAVTRLHDVTKRHASWAAYAPRERELVKMTVDLTGVLYGMCKIHLLATKGDEEQPPEINQTGITVGLARAEQVTRVWHLPRISMGA